MAQIPESTHPVAPFADLSGTLALAGGGALYVGVLFLIAWAADRRARPGRFAPRASLRSGLVYALTLAVYNTSWSFYGSVGKAARSGFEFLPIYIGPTLLLLFARPMLRRIVEIVRTQNITSIADFMAARYGKSQAIGVFVTLASLFVMMPYVALQLKAVATTFDLLTRGGVRVGHGAIFGDTAFWVAASMALFSILFGVRHIHAREHHHGLMLAIAFESFVKLALFVGVGVFIVVWLADASAPTRTAAPVEAFEPGDLAWISDTLVSIFAFLCLPHTFHAAFVEIEDDRDISRAAAIYPLYLGILSSLMLPVAHAGLALLPADVDPDTFMIRLPMTSPVALVSFAAFIGGLSAATGMIIMSTVALSTMICNDAILPIWLRRRGFDALDGIRPFLLRVRRAGVMAVLLLAYLAYRLLDRDASLTMIGLASFVGVAQLGPAFVGGLLWPAASRAGALAGITVGLAIWIGTLVVPFGPPTLVLSAFGFGPEDIPGAGLDPVSRSAFLSLACNVIVFVAVSLTGGRSQAERIQAELFTGRQPIRMAQPLRSGIVTTMDDLRELATQFAGREPGLRALEHHFSSRAGGMPDANGLADLEAVRFTESLVAGAIGAASARLVIATRIQGGRMLSRQAALAMLDEASTALQFSQRLLQSTLESVGQGICVLDEAGRLSVWNSRFADMLDLPSDVLKIGAKLPDRADLEPLVAPEAAGDRAQSLERTYRNGLVIDVNIRDLPAGGRVATFVDVTERHRAAEALRIANETLEERVRSRTLELEAARAAAERANASKSRFLAAAGHDLLQPLSATRLFISAMDARLAATDLSDSEREDLQSYALRASRALNATEQLLDGLLDISALDSGALTPDIENFDLGAFLQQLVDESRPLAERKGLDLRFVPAQVQARTDPRLLRRIVQNLLSNAIRYTSRGRIVLGVRRRPRSLRIEIWDTGPGIPHHEQEEIFQEFRRLAAASQADEKGLGLGLAIVERVSRLLGLEHGLASQPGKGSLFFVEVPRSWAAEISPADDTEPAEHDGRGLRILCIDDDPVVRDGLASVLSEWGHDATCLGNIEAALDAASPALDLLIVDYDLGAVSNGIDLIQQFRQKTREDVPALLLTASRSEAVHISARELRCSLLHKPVKPAALRRFLTSVRLGAGSGQARVDAIAG